MTPPEEGERAEFQRGFSVGKYDFIRLKRARKKYDLKYLDCVSLISIRYLTSDFVIFVLVFFWDEKFILIKLQKIILKILSFLFRPIEKNKFQPQKYIICPGTFSE